MRRGRLLGSMLAFLVATAAPAHATSVTVVLSGDWSQVTDNAGVTDGSISVDGTFSVALTFDDATPDSDPDPTVGSYLLPAATSALTLSTGSYTFSLVPGQDIVFGIDDDWVGQDDFGWFAEDFATSGPLPLGVTTGYGYMNPFVLDSTQTAHDSDALTDLPWSVSAYDFPSMYFLIAVNGAGANKYIELIGDFTQFSVLPEPSTLALVGFGCALLLRARGRV